MSVSDRAAEAMESNIVAMSQGHSFVMEQGRLAMLEGKMGARESLSHRIISESGSSQSRAQLPGGNGGAPTVVAGP